MPPVGVQPSDTGPLIAPKHVEGLCTRWAQEFNYFCVTKGIDYRTFRDWDRLTPRQREQLEELLDKGYDNITRHKLGGPN